MNDYHYTYFHIDPRTEEIVYIGHGCYERAWVCRKTGPGRSEEHAQWCLELMMEGYTPQDWVEIYVKGLTKQDAKFCEQLRIQADQPRFNKSMGVPKKLQGKVIDRLKNKREEGFSYESLGLIFGVSTMTAWRTLNG